MRVCSTSRWNFWWKSMAKSSSVKIGGTGSATASIRTSRIVKGSADGTMCLVFLGSRVNRNTPVMIGANREESFRRPITSPLCCRSGSIRCLVAGADHGPDGTFAEMGTWLGVNESGLVVAVTNRRDGELAGRIRPALEVCWSSPCSDSTTRSKPLVSPSTRSRRAASEAVIF